MSTPTQTEHLTEILNTMQDAIMAFSLPDRQLLFASASVEVVLGYPIEAFRNDAQFFRRVVHPDDLPLILDAMQQCRRDGFVELAHRIILPDGQVRWVQRRAWVNFDAEGRPVRVIDTARDITAQKQAEAALLRSEAQFQQFMRHLPGAVFIKDAEGRTVYCNDLYARLSGYTPGEIIGKCTDEYLPPAIAAPFIQENAAVLAGDSAQEFNHTFPSAGGLSHWLTVKFPIPRQGQPPLLGAISLDITKEKRAETALRQSEAHLRSLLDSQTTFNVRVDTQGNITFCNERYAQQFGWMAPSLIGLSSLDMVAPEDHNQVRAAVEQCLAQVGAPVQVELRKHTQDGGRMWTLWEFIAVQDESGKVTEIQCVGFDITRQKLAELHLRTSEARQRAILRAIPDLMFRLDEAGRFLDYYASADDILLVPPAVFLGKTLVDVMPPDLAPQLMDAVAKVHAGQPLVQQEYSLLLHGQLHAFEARFTPAGASEVLVMVRDVTERKEAEQALQAAHDQLERRVQERTLALEAERKLFRQFVESAPIATIICDANGAIVLVNQETEKLFGYSREALLGGPIEMFVPESLRLAHVGLRTNYLEQPSRRRVGALELEAQHQDGHTFPVEIQLSYVGATPAPLVMCQVIDVTARHTAEAALRQALAQEKELGELKSRFVSMASHEFRTPLATMLALTEMLTLYRDRMNAAQIDQRLARIRQQIDHMSGILEDVLQLARIQAGRMEFNPIDGDLAALCQAVIEELGSFAAHPGRIHFVAPAALPPVCFDLRLMRQVLTNLLSNALKYSAADQPVEIRLGVTPGQIVIQVIDTGIGIPAEEFRHLFEPFHRAANVGAISGTGLGLSITRQAVELHGGEITVDSFLGVGTTVTVTIPRLAPVAADDAG